MYNVVIVHRTDVYNKYDEEVVSSHKNLEDAEKSRADRSKDYTLKNFREDILGVFVRPVGK